MANKKILQMHFEFTYFYFSYWFGIETIDTFIHSRSSLENHTPIPDQNGQSVYPFSDQKDPKFIPFGAAHTYMAYIREYLASPGLPMGLLISIISLMSDLKVTNF